MWKLTDKGKGVVPLPGVPWGDLTDYEFRQAAHDYAEQGFPTNALGKSGFFEHIKDEPAEGSTPPPAEEPPAEDEPKEGEG